MVNRKNPIETTIELNQSMLRINVDDESSDSGSNSVLTSWS